MVEMSPWPILASSSALGLTFGGMFWWHFKKNIILILSLVLNILMVTCWFSDILKEKMSGFHKKAVMFGIRAGMILFMASEVLFFFSFFWSYFHNCWGPQKESGYMWPPFSFKTIVVDPFSIPLLNTVVLLSSGVTITWAHHALIEQNFFSSAAGMGLTSLLGIYFLFLQGTEYFLSSFSMNSSVYGTVFFVLTGFHGFHVTMGTVLLLMCFFRHVSYHFSKSQHVGFETSAWYWHFVDVVWIFLYFFIYWYGFKG